MITSLTEKIGGIHQLDLDYEIFKEIILNLQLVDWETRNGTHT
jgi:hypothetical protein